MSFEYTILDSKYRSLPLSLELNTTDNTKAFHVPNTYITLLWTPVSDQPIEYKLLCNLIKDAIIEVTNVIKHFGDSLLPDNKDPYIDVKYVGKAPAGAYIRMQSPVDGPAYGRKLTWGNVKDTLSGLRDIMIKEGRTYKIYFEIRNDNLGLIGRGCVAPGEPTSPLPRLGDGVDEQS